MQGSFPALWRYSRGVMKLLMMLIQTLNKVSCRRTSMDATKTEGPSMMDCSSWVMLLNPRVMMMTLKAFLFMVFQFSVPLDPSPGPGCFRTRRTRRPQ